MSEPLKPRIDFAGPLEVEQNQTLKTQQTFSETQAQTFAPAQVDEPLEDEGRRKRSLTPRCALNAVCGARW